jgi:hypothetical protein
MAISTDLRIGTKSIRTKADFEDYVRQFNRDNKAEYTAFYAKDAVVSEASHHCRTYCRTFCLTLSPIVQVQWFPRQESR